MPIKNIIFDLDETLYNDQDVKAEADVQVLKFLSTKLTDIDIVKHYNLFKESDRETIFDWFKTFLGNFQSDQINEELIKNTEEVYWNVLSQIKPYPDALIFLDNIKDKYALGILSDGSRNKQLKKMEALAIEHFFNPDFLVFSEDVGEKKPSPKMFDAIINKMSINPAETLYIGDRVDRDIVGGNKAGFQTALLRRNRSYNVQTDQESGQPTMEINTFFELFDKLDLVGSKGLEPLTYSV